MYGTTGIHDLKIHKPLILRNSKCLNETFNPLLIRKLFCLMFLLVHILFLGHKVVLDSFNQCSFTFLFSCQPCEMIHWFYIINDLCLMS